MIRPTHSLASRMRIACILAHAGLAAVLASQSAVAAHAPAGHGGFAAPVEDAGLRPAAIQIERAESERSRTPNRAGASQLYPSYTWPMESTNHDSARVVAYVDEDPSAGFLDYDNGHWTYDTHRGTDIALADFRAMDRGMRIRSAAPGTVTFAVWNNLRDRNCDQPDNPTLNYLEVANGDGTYTYYFHLRANSVTVNLGEAVQRGQVLGLAGSSGYSFGPHLHFEPADYLAGYQWRDPWGGPANPNPGLWNGQEPWEGSQHLRVYGFGVSTETAAGGDLTNLNNFYCSHVTEHLEQPAVLGIGERYFPVWLYPQGVMGDVYRIEIRKPDQSLWGDVDYTLPFDLVGGYQYWYWDWAPWVSAADYGTWTAKILVNGQTARLVPFVVGPATVFGPRFRPGVGRSFRISGAVQRDTLRVTALGGPVTYSLVNAPSSVTLADSIVTIAASSTQPTRSHYFRVIAQDASARRDTAYLHLVDPSKPQEPVADISEAARPNRVSLAAGVPNPFVTATTIEFTLARESPVTLAILDLAGRRVRTLVPGVRLEPGPHRVGWDGRDELGAAAPAGIYFCRLTADGERVVRRIARLR